MGQFYRFHDSAMSYSMDRRQRVRAMGDIEANMATIAGAETAAAEPASSAFNSIMIGVATGALTYVATRMIEELILPRKGRK